MDENRSSQSEPPLPTQMPDSGVSRRSFIQTMGLSAAAAGAMSTKTDAATMRPQEAAQVTILGPDPIDIALTAVSGAMREYVLFADQRPQFDPVEDEHLAAELTDLFCNYLRIR